MEGTDLQPLLEDLREHVDDLEVALGPLLRTNHSDILSKLPLLDKAKLSVLTIYAIESILFSVLNLNGVNAKEHAVFHELSRVKQYFEKIKEAESAGTQQKSSTKLDGAAANRFIKHALAGNEKHDRDRTERQAAEKANARAKLEEMRQANKVADKKESSGKRKRVSASPRKENAEGPPVFAEASQATHGRSANENRVEEGRKERKKAKREGRAAEKMDVDGKVGQKKKQKSSKPPKDSKAAFNDLVNRKGGTDPT